MLPNEIGGARRFICDIRVPTRALRHGDHREHRGMKWVYSSQVLGRDEWLGWACDLLKLRKQRREVVSDGIPQNVKIHGVIFMNKTVSHPCYF